MFIVHNFEVADPRVADEDPIDGVRRAEALAGDISSALYSTAAGWAVCPIGVVIIIVSSIRLGKLEPEPEDRLG